LKVLFIGRYNESEILNGPEKVAKRIFNKCSAEFETAFVTYFFDGRKNGIFKKFFGEEVLSGIGNQMIYRLGIFRLISYMFKFKPEIIHLITFERFSIISLIYKKCSKAKMYYNVHGIAAIENESNSNVSLYLKWKDKYCEKQYFKNSDKFVFLSEDSVNLAGKYYPIGRSKIKVIPNGIDKLFQQSVQRQFNFTGKLKLVFISGENKKEKGFDFLISAMSSLTFRVELFIIGDPSNFRITNSLKVDLIFVNKMDTDALANFYKDKDIFISASSYEQFSIATVEAMAAGLVPVVTEETGMSSYIENGKNGFRIKYGEKESLNKILLLLNNDSDKLIEISNEAKKIYDQLSWDLVYEKYKNLYQ